MYRRAVCWAAIAVALPVLLLVNSGHDPVAHGTVSSDMPPIRYRGNNKATVVFRDQAGIEEACGKPEKDTMIACRRQNRWSPNGDLEWYAKIMCHEMGHVNGWSGDHEP